MLGRKLIVGVVSSVAGALAATGVSQVPAKPRRVTVQTFGPATVVVYERRWETRMELGELPGGVVTGTRVGALQESPATLAVAAPASPKERSVLVSRQIAHAAAPQRIHRVDRRQPLRALAGWIRRGFCRRCR